MRETPRLLSATAFSKIEVDLDVAKDLGTVPIVLELDFGKRPVMCGLGMRSGRSE